MLINHVSIVPRSIFLHNRKREVDEARLLNQAEAIADGSTTFIILDAGDDIVCDWCNGNIDNPLVLIVNDNDAACEHCIAQEIERSL